MPILLICISEFCVAQNATLEEAILLYKRRSYPAALVAIDQVKRNPNFAKNPNVWNYAMLINDKMMGKAYSFQDTTDYVLNLIEAYKNCRFLDQDNKFTHKSNALMKKKTIFFKHKADWELAKGKTSEYYKAQKLYILCLKGHGKSSAVANLSMARTYRGHKEYDNALMTYNDVISLDYEVVQTYTEALAMLNDANRREQSDSLFAVVLQRFPGNVSFRLIEITDLIDRNLYFKARTITRELITENKSNSELQYQLGLSNMRLNLQEDAIESLEDCLDINTNHYGANYEAGLYYLNQGISTGDNSLLMKSKIALEKCESIQPEDDKLLEMLRDLYLEIRDMENYQRINTKLDN